MKSSNPFDDFRVVVKAEADFLFGLNFNLSISEEQFLGYEKELQQIAQDLQPPVCAIQKNDQEKIEAEVSNILMPILPRKIVRLVIEQGLFAPEVNRPAPISPISLKLINSRSFQTKFDEKANLHFAYESEDDLQKPPPKLHHAKIK